MDIQTVKTETFSMDYCSFGKGSRTMVIIPGLSLFRVMNSADDIAKAYEPMTNDFTVYVFDPRSDLPEKYSIDDMAEDTVKVMNILGLKDIHLFGASLGGMVSLMISLNHPEIVSKVAIGSSTVNPNAKSREVLARWIQLSSEQKGEELCLDFGKNVYPDEVYQQIKEGLISMGKQATEEEFRRFTILANTVDGFDINSHLHLLQRPLLVCADDTDQLFGLDAIHDLKELNNENIQFYTSHGYGHAAYDFDPNYKNQLLEFYLKKG